jgi:hypothetical protein
LEEAQQAIQQLFEKINDIKYKAEKSEQMVNWFCFICMDNGVVWYGMVWYGMVWCGVVWCGVVWCGVVWCDVVWYGMVWYGMVWYGVVL